MEDEEVATYLLAGIYKMNTDSEVNPDQPNSTWTDYLLYSYSVCLMLLESPIMDTINHYNLQQLLLP